MKIDQQNIQQNGGAGSSQATGAAQEVKGGRGAVGKGNYGLGGDRVELSSLSEAVRSSISTTPERTQALEQIGRDVQQGRYHVDSLAVSRGLVADALLA